MEENILVTLSNDFINKTQQSTIHKGKNDEFDYISIKDFWITKRTMDKVNRWVTFWEKIFTASKIDKGSQWT